MPRLRHLDIALQPVDGLVPQQVARRARGRE